MPSKTLLHVDDTPDDLFLFAKASSQAGVSFHLQSVGGGKEAIEYVQGTGPYSDRSRFPVPDLVLLDLKMPAPNGFEVLRWIRGHPEFQRLAVCILTSSFQYEDIQKAYALGTNCFLTKPPSFERLVALAATLDRSLLQAPCQLDALTQTPEFRK